MKTRTMSLLAAAGGFCLLPVTALYAADADPAAEKPAEVTAPETKDTMSLSIVVAKGGG